MKFYWHTATRNYLFFVVTFALQQQSSLLQQRSYGLQSLRHSEKIFANSHVFSNLPQALYSSEAIKYFKFFICLYASICLFVSFCFLSLSVNTVEWLGYLYFICIPNSHTYQNCNCHLPNWHLCVFQQVNLSTFFVCSCASPSMCLC